MNDVEILTREFRILEMVRELKKLKPDSWIVRLFQLKPATRPEARQS
jgi:hypothetical protein